MNGIEVSPVKPGQVLAGRYRVERVIGVGGMGVVVAATHVALDQLVAVKFLLPHALLQAEIVARFSREAQAAVRIRSEHVARVLDVGQLDNGAPFIVMEYLEGRDIHAIKQERGVLSVEQAVDYVLQACEAIAEAHELGIVHRDLKPANLFLVENRGIDTVKVLDFGISKMSTAGQEAMTQSATLLGSPTYMSPEQIASTRDVDATTDIWALGVILYELVAGQPPFAGASLTEMCLAITQQVPVPLASRRSDVSAAFNQVVMRCLEKDRSKRFDTVADFALALTEFAPPRSRLSLERIRNRTQHSGPNPIAQPLDGQPEADETDIPAGNVAPPSRSLAALPVASPDSAVEGTQAGWGNTAKRRSPRSVLGFAAGAVVVIAASGALWALRSTETGTPSSSSSWPAPVEVTSAVVPLHEPARPVSSAGTHPAKPATMDPAPSQAASAEPPVDVAPASPRSLERASASAVRTAQSRRAPASQVKMPPGAARTPSEPEPRPATPSPRSEWEDER